jgi:hypothetical protein
MLWVEIGQHDASDLDVTVGVRSVVLGQDGRSAGYEKFTQRAGSLLRGRNCSTIRWLVYSRVVFHVLVLQIIGINSVRSGLASRYAVSLSSTPDIL